MIINEIKGSLVSSEVGDDKCKKIERMQLACRLGEILFHRVKTRKPKAVCWLIHWYDVLVHTVLLNGWHKNLLYSFCLRVIVSPLPDVSTLNVPKSLSYGPHQLRWNFNYKNHLVFYTLWTFIYLFIYLFTFYL